MEKTINDELVKAIRQVVALSGFDRSESGSEAFLFALTSAADKVALDVEDSHNDGLCYDTTVGLANELEKIRHKIAIEEKKTHTS